ncbi:hypothetical protein F4778DRAFT_779227 [Xylariomycetidae sp. FL2044]|nr:hypothetical protein F4778DRAFT_779227 [Xylariomycetidae sp. FL2044]
MAEDLPQLQRRFRELAPELRLMIKESYRSTAPVVLHRFTLPPAATMTGDYSLTVVEDDKVRRDDAHQHSETLRGIQDEVLGQRVQVGGSDTSLGHALFPQEVWLDFDRHVMCFSASQLEGLPVHERSLVSFLNREAEKSVSDTTETHWISRVQFLALELPAADWWWDLEYKRLHRDDLAFLRHMKSLKVVFLTIPDYTDEVLRWFARRHAGSKDYRFNGRITDPGRCFEGPPHVSLLRKIEKVLDKHGIKAQVIKATESMDTFSNYASDIRENEQLIRFLMARTGLTTERPKVERD